jgi:hypothetical protein
MVILLGLAISMGLLAFPCSSLNVAGRREVVWRLTVRSATALGVVSMPSTVLARNLPESTGADLSQTGSIDMLIPILRVRSGLSSAQEIVSRQSRDNFLSVECLQELEKEFKFIPKTERDFKRLFDQYSDPVSYKQKFLDQNAFLVYYSRGFDGPNRPNIENNLPETQTLQFGSRNEAWVAWESLQAELDFAIKSPKDSSIHEIMVLIGTTLEAVDAYVALAPPDDVKAATRLLQ